eukprot:5207849-Amphidinium_carterae.3
MACSLRQLLEEAYAMRASICGLQAHVPLAGVSLHWAIMNRRDFLCDNLCEGHGHCRSHF